jgi:Bacterial surface proteins containing Ig-like domains
MKTKRYTVFFLVFLLLFILGGAIPQMIHAEELDEGGTIYSTKLESLTLRTVNSQIVTFDKFNSYNFFGRYFYPSLLDEENNIYYADLSGNKNANYFLFISGERKSSTATVTIKDMADPDNLGEKNFALDYTIGYTGTGVKTGAEQTVFPKNPFITTGGSITTFLRAHYGMSCFEITVTDNNESEVYYLILKDGGTMNPATASSDIKVDFNNITFYNGATKDKLADECQYVKTNSYDGIVTSNQIFDGVKSIRLSLDRDMIPEAEPIKDYPYIENTYINKEPYFNEFYRQDSNYISINGSPWSRVDGDGVGLSSELILKQGLNILQIRSASDEEFLSFKDDIASGNFSTRVILLYRDGDNNYTLTPGEDVSLKDNGIQLYRAFKPETQNPGKVFKQYDIYEENGKNYINLTTSDQYLLIKVPTVDSDAIIGINGATQKVGGSYFLYLDPDVLNEETPISISITPANGDETKEELHDIYIKWTQGGANMEGVEITNATLDQEFSSDLFRYLVTPTGSENVSCAFTLTEGALISAISKDWTELDVTDTMVLNNNTITVGADTQELIVTVDATSGGVSYSNVYYFEFLLEKEAVSDDTKQRVKTMLDESIKNFEASRGDQLTKAYWDIFAYAAANGDLNGKYAYDVETHNSTSATSYGAIILELVLGGENPYNYHGINYVQKLLGEQGEEGGFGAWGNNIWALMALDAAGAQYDNQEMLINTVASQAASSSFDLDMRGWALIASASHSNVPGVEARIASAVRDIKNYQETEGEYNGAFQNPFYTNYNILSHSCVVSGLAASGLDINGSLWTNDDKSALTYLERTEFVGLDSTQYIIALGDVYNGSSVWQRAALTREEFDQLVVQAETAFASTDDGLKKDNLNEKLMAAKTAAQSVGENVVTGLGESYYALKNALALVDSTVKPDVTIGSDQVQADYVIGLITAGTTEETKKIAKLAYYALNDTQKALVVNRDQILDDSDIAGEVTIMINALPSVESITIDHKTAVMGVRSAYDLLTESQKLLISTTTLQKLTDSEAKIKALEGAGEISADQKAANAVIEKINALGSISSYSQKATVDAARAAYTSLTTYQRTLVTNLGQLEAAEAKIIVLTPECTITVAIERFTIGQGFYVEPQSLTIKQGDTAWDALEKLLGAENMVVGNDPGYLAAIKGADSGTVSIAKYIIDELNAGDTNAAKSHGKTQSGNTLGEKDYSDYSGWMYFVNNSSPSVGMKGSTLKNGDVLRLAFTYWGTGADVTGKGTDGNNVTYEMSFTPENRDSLLKALAKVNCNTAYLSDAAISEAYEAAMTIVQDMTAKIKPINDATTALNKAIADYKPGEPANDAKLAKVVTDQIAALPAVAKLTLTDKDAVIAARTAYDALTTAQKALVTNLSTLTTAEAKITELQNAADKVAAKAVTDKIAALPTVAKLVLTDKDAVAAARAAYDALSEAQKKLVTNLDTLTAIEAQMAKLLAGEATEADKASAKAVSDLIAGLPSGEKLALGSKADVVAARTAYNKLTDIQKALVTNLDALAAAEARIAELEAATPPAKDEATGIEVVGLPEGVGLKVEPGDADKTDEAEKAAVAAGIKDAKVVSLYSIKPDMSDEALAEFNNNPDSFVTLTMPLGDDQQGYDSYKIYHKKTDGTVEWITPILSADGKSLFFKVNAFSEFGVVATKASTEIPVVDFSYRTHVQNVGWQDWKNNGAMSGTQGRSLRLEGIEIKRTDSIDVDLGIRYKTHIENIGWEDSWKADGTMSGTEGKALRLEAIRIELTGAAAENYDVYYQVHAQNTGWMAFAKNGEDAGTAGFGYRLEGIHVIVVPKGQAVPTPEEGSIETAFLVKN